MVGEPKAPLHTECFPRGSSSNADLHLRHLIGDRTLSGPCFGRNKRAGVPATTMMVGQLNVKEELKTNET
jgi:hypothetical protein